MYVCNAVYIGGVFEILHHGLFQILAVVLSLVPIAQVLCLVLVKDVGSHLYRTLLNMMASLPTLTNIQG